MNTPHARNWFGFASLIMLVCTSSLFPQVPEMGENYRPNYEVYKMERLIGQGDPSYSGDLNLSIPLMTVPGRHGNNFDIVLTYSSNISQRQTASWVGLGWNLELGNVQRSVMGRSDDQCKGLWPGQNLGRGNSDSVYEAEKIGRLSEGHPILTSDYRDQIDNYSLSVDGSSLEILPFPLNDSATAPLSPSSFRTLSWRPWSIGTNWDPDSNTANQISYFLLTKEDGTSYEFGWGVDYDDGLVNDVHVHGLSTDGANQDFKYPYRWNLSRIFYPDGSRTMITYKKHSIAQLQRPTESIFIHRTYDNTEAGNLFGDGNPSISESIRGTVKYEYSVPETLYTDTHFAVFTSTQTTTDSTDRGFKLTKITLYERATQTELKRVEFSYAITPNDSIPEWLEGYPSTHLAPPWSNRKLNNNQLTLMNVQILAGSTENPLSLPPYKFSYYENPRLSLRDLSHYSDTNASFPGYHIDTIFGRAWRLKDLIMPTGGRIQYTYQCLNTSSTPGGFDVDVDPEGRNRSSMSVKTELRGLPFSFKAAPRSRLVEKLVTDSMGVAQRWTFSYCDTVVFDPPSHPNSLGFTPNAYDGQSMIFGDLDYRKIFRGCQVGHRWVKVTGPDGSWKKSYYTSSFDGAGVYDATECQGDSILPSIGSSPPESDFLIASSRYGRRGLVWKEETNTSTILYKYWFEPHGQFKDRWEYHNFPGGGVRGDLIEQTSIFARLDSVITIQDGVRSFVFYKYGDVDGLVNKMTESGSKSSKVTWYDRASSKYAGMASLGMKSQLYSTMISSGEYDDDVKDWTTWGDFGGKWLPRKKWAWNSSSTDSDAPLDTTSEVIGVTTYNYDDKANVTEVTDANGFKTIYYYGDNDNPFTNTTNGKNLGLVTGVQLPQTTPTLRRSFKYDLYGNVTQKKDENGDSTRLVYDDLGRLVSVIGPNAQPLKSFSYTYLTSSQPNKIRVSSYRTSTDSIVTVTYYDGIGFERQKITWFGTNDLVWTTTYDSLRRVSRVYKPYSYAAGHAYDPSFDAHAKSSWTDCGIYPFTLRTYELDPAGRIRNEFYADTIFSNSSLATNKYTKYEYGTNGTEIFGHQPNTLRKTSVTDENGNKAISYKDRLGNSVASIVDSAGLRLTTLMDYDVAGRLVRIVSPMSYPPAKMLDTVNIYYPAQQDSIVIQALPPGSPKTATVILATRQESGGMLWNWDYDPEYAFDPQEPPGITINYRIRQFSSGSLISETSTQMLADPAPKPNWEGTGSGIFALSEQADEVRLVVTSVSYDNSDYYAEVKLNCVAQDARDTYITFNTRGQVVRKYNVDNGITLFRYDAAGNLRFSQSAAQAAAGKFTYMKYDSLSRLIQVGDYTGTFSTMDSTTRGAASLDAPTSGGVLSTVNVYDANTTGNADLTSARNLLGRVFNVQAYNGGIRDDVYSSYDDFGRPEWEYHKFGSLEAKRLAYEYDLQGNITKIGFKDFRNVGNNTYFFYEYDAIGRLARVYSGRNDNGTGKVKDVEYTYRDNGQVSRKVLGTAQGVDYAYNERDWLTRINDTTLGSDAVGVQDRFGMKIGYYDSTSVGAAQNARRQYNGNVSWMAYTMSGATSPASLVGYTFGYDKANRLDSANFGMFTSSWQSTNAYDVRKYRYDKNGNIDSAVVHGSNGNVMDFLKYNYATTIVNYGSAPSDPGAFDQRDAGWTKYPGTAHDTTILRDGSTPIDNTYWIYTVEQPSAGFYTFIVNLDDPVGTLDPNGTVTVRARYSVQQPLVGDARVTFSVLEGTTVLAQRTDYNLAYTTYTLTVPRSSIGNPNNLKVKIKAYIEVDDAFHQPAVVIVTWVRAEFPTVQYGFANNKLLHITDTVGNSSFPTDLDNQAANNYLYDANGNVIKDVKNGLDTLIYDYRNLPLQVKKNGLTTTYRYDASGTRVSKSTSGTTTYYLHDYLGRTLGVLANNGDPIMMNIWGLDHAGYVGVSWAMDITCTGGGEESITPGDTSADSLIIEVPSTGDSGQFAESSGGGGGGGQVCDTTWIRTDSRYYYLKDHLGTIKVTVKSDGTVASYDDFYPYGMVMDGRSMASSGDARYKFTGHEKDTESGLDYFGARYFGAREARWLEVDPLARNYPRNSPYCYSVSNPVTFYDPDGKDVTFHSSVQNSRFYSAFDTYMSTSLGMAQNMRFEANHDILVVYAVGDISSRSGITWWVPKDEQSAGVDATWYNIGLIDITSEGKQVILIVIDAETMEKGSTQLNAETIYHEGRAHVEYSLDGLHLSEEEAHKLYGASGDPRSAPKGTPAYKFWKEVNTPPSADTAPGSYRNLHSQQYRGPYVRPDSNQR